MSQSMILLFDGVCNLCQGSVRFVLERDRAGLFQFASLQSPKGKDLLEQHGLPTDELSHMVLIEEGRAYIRSTAVLRTARRLSGLWPLLYAFILVPRFLRDPLYDWVASNRYRWFGRQDACMIPTPELRSRFLD